MLFEDLIMLLALFSGVFLIGIPVWKLVRAVVPEKRDPVAEARVRLEAAKADAEAAKLNKETEKVYEEIYGDVLEDEETNKSNGRRV
jgi:F0F1-type ATP synthase membrane subunit b/b'